jgi:hypothetical protein
MKDSHIRIRRDTQHPIKTSIKYINSKVHTQTVRFCRLSLQCIFEVHLFFFLLQIVLVQQQTQQYYQQVERFENFLFLFFP